MTAWVKKIVDIKPQERMKTFIMFFYFFSIIATVWMLKPVRNSLFIDELGAKNLRYVYMGEGVFLIAVVWLFVKFSKIITKKALYNSVLLLSIACLIFFWFLFGKDIPYLSAFFYVWAASYSIIMTTQFFMLANDIFDPLQAKRLFGFILSGGSIGGVLGGMLTSQLVGSLGTVNLLLVIAVVIGLCNLLVMKNWEHLVPDMSGLSAAEQKKAEEEKAKKAAKESGRKLLMGSAYLMMLAGLIMIVKMTSAIVDNQFNAVVEMSIAGKDARTAFYGGFFSFLNALSFTMQILVTSIVFKHLGVGIALWILPVGLTMGSFATIVHPALLTGVILKAFDGSTNYSIQQATREVLYLPVDSSVRYRVKPVIDMLGYRIAKSLGGVFIVIAAPLFSVPDHRMSILALCLLPIWYLLAWNMRKGYSNTLRDNLIKQDENQEGPSPEQATDVLGTLYDEKTLESMKPYFNHRSSYARKLSSTAYSLYLRAGKDFETAKQKINELVQREAVNEKGAADDSSGNEIKFIEELFVKEAKEKVKEKGGIEAYLSNYPEDVLMKLGAILQNPKKPLESKRKAVRLLELIPKQESVDLLLSSMGSSHDHALRFILVKALNKLHDKKSSLKMNRFLVKNEISRECDIYHKLNQLQVFYDRKREQGQEQTYLKVTLNAVEMECVERLFRLLDLLYPYEIIQIIHDRIQTNDPKDLMRSHAIELLNNTLDRDILSLMKPVLEEKSLIRVDDKKVVKILEEFISKQDQWFYLISVFLITELKMDEQWPKLSQLVEEADFLQLN